MTKNSGLLFCLTIFGSCLVFSDLASARMTAGNSATRTKTITIAEKQIRLTSALKLAVEMAEKSLANRKYAGKIRPSTQKSGPRDIRNVLDGFIIDMSGNLAQSRLIYDGSGYSQLACKKKGTLAGVVNGGPQIYMCDFVFTRDDAGIAEVILHEYTHVIGYNRNNYDECSATEVAFHAVIASGGTPWGDGYTHSYKECLKMSNAAGKLAAELRDPSDQATSIKAGTRIVFSETLGAQIFADLKSVSMYMRPGPIDQEIEIDDDSTSSRVPRDPLVVKINKSKNDSVEFRLVDADGFEFNFIAMGISQIALPLSALKKYGISFESPQLEAESSARAENQIAPKK